MNNQSIKISENCWKHINEYGDIYYTKTSDPDSELHREDGPAIKYASGSKLWYINGKCHRTDGPAVEFPNGTKEWYYDGKRIYMNSQEEFEIYIKNLIFI